MGTIGIGIQNPTRTSVRPEVPSPRERVVELTIANQSPQTSRELVNIRSWVDQACIGEALASELARITVPAGSTFGVGIIAAVR